MGDRYWDGARWVDAPAQALPTSSARPLQEGVDWLRQLGWRDFELLVADAFRAQGFAVTVTQGGADGGIDLILDRGTEKWFVQCKHWNAWKVGAPVVREMRGLVAHHGASGGIIVTSGSFSEDAYAFARESGIQLVGGPATLEFVTNARLPEAALMGGTAPQGVPTAAPQAGAPRCPVCGTGMVLRRARSGGHRGQSFWGCSRYPSCRGMVPLQPWEQAAVASATSGGAARTARRRASARNSLVRLTISLVVLAVGLYAVTLVPGWIMSRLTDQPGPSPTRPAGVVRGEVSGSVTVGRQPMAIAVDPAAARGYTADFDSGTVTVIDLRTLAIVRELDVPGRPAAIAVDIVEKVLWVADFNSTALHGLDTETGEQLAELEVDEETDSLAIDPKRHRLYAASRTSDDIRVFDTAARKRLKGLDGSSPGALAMDVQNRRLYAVNRSIGSLHAYDTKDKAWSRTGSLGYGGTFAVAVDGDRRRMYSSHNGRVVTEHNLATGKTKALDAEADALALDPATRTLYVVDTEAGIVSALPVG